MTEGDAWAVHVTAAAGIDAELAADALWQAGAVAVEERSLPDAAGVLLVASGADRAEPAAAALAAAVAGRWQADVVAVDLGAALDAWRPHARALTVGPVTVRPPWVEPVGGTGTLDVVIDPGRAFGSGAHVSTRLALGALVAAPAGARVVDVGCGSGVLAIAALLLGTRSAVGIDIDPAALDASRANAARNGVADRLTLVAGEAVVAGGTGGAGGPTEPAELVVANMLAPVLVDVAPAVTALVAPGGRLVLAGFLTEQQDRVRRAYDALDVEHEHAEDGWASLTLHRR